MQLLSIVLLDVLTASTICKKFTALHSSDLLWWLMPFVKAKVERYGGGGGDGGGNRCLEEVEVEAI